MAVSCTYSPGFGVKITVGLPRHVGREAGFELCDAIDALIRERLDGGVVKGGRGATNEVTGPRVKPGATEGAPAAEAAPLDGPATEADAEQKRPFMSSEAFAAYAKEESLRRWPHEGTVDLSQIVAFWTIGKSSFRQRVSSGEFVPALEMKGRSKASPKLWGADAIGKQLADAGFFMRGIQ
ncbi:hypothetical protein [Cloacibacillus evryensis]|uniref:hypothetical protein n=1 Tax=Cloacibacillus evryensis TaxID=508460 RepID=UPI00210E64B9|nr:hypothetical protein [Cloacibacillus evryensis]MCQ4763472.1 hypothetical protein [Cloacibacillus evryensis]